MSNELQLQLDAIALLTARAESQYTALESTKSELKKRSAALHAAMDEAGLPSIATGLAEASIEMVKTYRPVSWPDLHAYIAAHGAFELLHKRISITALREMDAAGCLPPGIRPDSYMELSVKLVKQP